MYYTIEENKRKTSHQLRTSVENLRHNQVIKFSVYTYTRRLPDYRPRIEIDQG